MIIIVPAGEKMLHGGAVPDVVAPYDLQQQSRNDSTQCLGYKRSFSHNSVNHIWSTGMS